MMELVMIRLILFAWFLLVAIVLLATDLSDGYRLKQINSTHFAQSASDAERDPIRHHG
jgi:hypothetical protein